MEATKLQSLSEIFTNKIFKVPDFQRGYSWESGQLEDLWEDLQILKPDKTHYTGMITVKPVDVAKVGNKEKWENDSWLLQKGYKAYYVIDGQQRLTSIIILIHEILDTLDDGEGINFGSKDEWVGKFLYCSSVGGYNYESFIFGYEKDDPSNEYFKTKILGIYGSLLLFSLDPHGFLLFICSTHYLQFKPLSSTGFFLTAQKSAQTPTNESMPDALIEVLVNR